VWLAGGLNPDNAREAIETVRPFALDLCSGIRSGEGYDLDQEKLNQAWQDWYTRRLLRQRWGSAG